VPVRPLRVPLGHARHLDRGRREDGDQRGLTADDGVGFPSGTPVGSGTD
jgi:hypothetical protein